MCFNIQSHNHLQSQPHAQTRNHLQTPHPRSQPQSLPKPKNMPTFHAQKTKSKNTSTTSFNIIKGRCDGIILALAFALSDRTRSFFRDNISYRTIYNFTFNTYPCIMKSEITRLLPFAALHVQVSEIQHGQVFLFFHCQLSSQS